jgi:hypothetical protein
MWDERPGVTEEDILGALNFSHLAVVVRLRPVDSRR